MSAALAFPDDDLPADQVCADAQTSIVGGDPNTEQANCHATPMSDPPVRPYLPTADQTSLDAHTRHVGGGDPNIRSGHRSRDAHRPGAAAEQSPEQATILATSIDAAPARALPPTAAHARLDAHPTNGGGGDLLPPAPATPSPTPRSCSPVLADPLLQLAADVLDDLERVRIANENRLRQLTRAVEDSDGIERGFGLPLDHPDVARQAAIVLSFRCDSPVAMTEKTPKKRGCCLEHDGTRNLEALVRKHPLGPWISSARGVGPKQGARLLAAIGDPYWNTPHNRPRTVSELWAYAGYHVLRTGQRTDDAQSRGAGAGPTSGNPDQMSSGAQQGPVGVAATRARGQRANWSATAKMRAHLVAVSIVKAGGPYRDVYDATRTKYEAATHQAECKRCGPAGKPAPPGSPLSDGHKHARALRAVAKTVLRDLWREAARLHGQAE